MRWRIMLELAGPDSTPQQHEVGSGERISTEHTAATLGLGLEEGPLCQSSCRLDRIAQ